MGSWIRPMFLSSVGTKQPLSTYKGLKKIYKHFHCLVQQYTSVYKGLWQCMITRGGSQGGYVDN